MVETEGSVKVVYLGVKAKCTSSYGGIAAEQQGSIIVGRGIP